MLIRNILLALLVILGFSAVGTPASAQATRTWVSGLGDDVNPCSRTAPCKTFAGAISKTATNGTINCLDPGGFGVVTIVKSITIDCESQAGGILAASTNGINVNGANIVVKIRNLAIEGLNTGLVGVNVIAGAAVHLDNVSITQFNAGAGAGIRVANASGTTTEVVVTNSRISENGINAATGAGVLVAPVAGATARVTLDNVQLVNNTNGFFANSPSSGTVRASISDSVITGNSNSGVAATTAGASTRVFVDRSTVVANGVGMSVSGGAGIISGHTTVTGNTNGLVIVAPGIIQSFGSNQLFENTTNGTFSGSPLGDS